MKKFGVILLLFVAFISCEEDPYGYEIEYQNGYPSRLAGNWKAYEFPSGRITELTSEPYDLVTAIDPNSEDSLVISNLYNSGLRVKAGFEKESFSVRKGKQLEVLDKAYGVEKISIYGELREGNEEDYLIFLAIYYDEYDSPVDSVFVQAYRKTGFEEVDQYYYDYLFED